MAVQGSVLHGTLLMIAYALGRGGVLLTVAGSVGLLKPLNLARASLYTERISGVLVLVASIGLLIFYNGFVGFTTQWAPMTK